jgi:hypothetical protein
VLGRATLLEDLVAHLERAEDVAEVIACVVPDAD